MRLLSLVLTAAVTMAPPFALAATFGWRGGVDGNSSSYHAEVWVLSGTELVPPPGPLDTALFDSGGGTSVFFSSDVTNSMALVTSMKSFNLGGNTYNADLVVTGAGNLNVNSGTISGDVFNDGIMVVTNSTFSGFEQTYFDGGGALFQSNSNIVANTVTVAGNAQLQMNSSHLTAQNVTIGDDDPGTALLLMVGGTLNVGGAGGLVIGDNAKGIVALIDVSTVIISSLTMGTTPGICGSDFCSSGSMQLTGTTSFTHSGHLAMGKLGFAQMLVEDGATLIAPSLTIGENSHAVFELTDFGSELDIAGGDINLGLNPGAVGALSVNNGATFTAPDDLIVGAQGFGLLDTISGALAVNGDLILGASDGSTGSWLVADELGEGPTTINVVGDIIVGWDGEGDLGGEHGAEILTINAQDLIVGHNGDPSTVDFNDFSMGTFNLTHSIIGNNADATMTLNGGNWNSTGDVIIARGDPISGGAVNSTVTTTDTVVTSQALVVGQSEDTVGELEMHGGSWQNNQTIIIGDSGTGTIKLYDGATLTSVLEVLIGNKILTGGSGTLELHGSGTELEVTTVGQGVRVGRIGQGTLLVDDGARLVAPFMRIGEGIGSDSSATFTGDGTTADIVGEIRLSELGNGRFTITDGAKVDSGFGTIDNLGPVPGFAATVTGENSMWTMFELVVGKLSRHGSLFVADSAQIDCFNCAIAEDVDSAGRLQLSDSPTHLNVENDLYIGGGDSGAGGDALMEVWSGARADVADITRVFSLGILDVRSGGLFYTDTLDVQSGYVGAIGTDSFIGVTNDLSLNSQLDVFSGGRVDSGSMTVAADSTGPSDIKVDGVGSILNVLGDLTFSSSGDGTLAASNSAQVFSDTATLDNGVGRFTVNTSVLSGAWWQTNNLIIGTDSLHGGVAIEGGGRMTCVFSCNIGAEAGARGLVTVTDPTSIFDSTGGEIIVGESGTGALQASSGGQVFSVGGHVGKNPGAEGSVEIHGSAAFWSSSADIHVGFERTGAEAGEGIVRLFDGARIAAPTIAVHDSGQLFGNGAIFGDLENGGLVGAGFDEVPATIFVSDDYMQLNDGALTLQIGGAAQGTEFGFLDVGANANLAGHLGVTLFDSFEPELGDAFIILTATAVLGEFDTVFLPDLGALEFFVVYGADFVSLSVINPTTIPLPGALWLIVSGLLVIPRYVRHCDKSNLGG